VVNEQGNLIQSGAVKIAPNRPNMENEIYKAISAVQGALAKEGIGKDQKNAQQGFKYRGIDDVYNSLAPLLSENKLCILPRMMNKEVVERQSKSGGVLTYTTITAEFDLVSAIDGSKHTVSSYGEAMDSGDKSIGKAMSYAYKAMAFMTFSIPTDGENDPDAETHEVAPKVLAERACSMCGKKFTPPVNYPYSTTCSAICTKHKKEGVIPELPVRQIED
jgi:hypothetical protein